MAGGSPVDQLDRVVSAQILGAIILGKFLGDLASIYLTDWFGQIDGMIIGALFGLFFIVFWPSIEKTFQVWPQALWEQHNGKKKQ